jgi:hypothetical protein
MDVTTGITCRHSVFKSEETIRLHGLILDRDARTDFHLQILQLTHRAWDVSTGVLERLGGKYLSTRLPPFILEIAQKVVRQILYSFPVTQHLSGSL